MSAPKKFLFDTSFEPPRDEAEAARAQGKPVAKYFDEDLEQAREEGFAAGKEAGEREAMGGIEQAIARTLDAIAQQLPALSRAQAEAEERQSREAVAVATTLVRKLFPKMARQQGFAEIESLVVECLERLREEPRIVIRVADALLDPVNERVSALAGQVGFEGRIVFLSQDELNPGDVRVEWADGGAERDSHRLWREADGVIERFLGVAPEAPAPDQPMAHKSALASA
ncbi:MAG: hypothetical protein ACE5GS_01960 [Kiloniellaceae bacterium]